MEIVKLGTVIRSSATGEKTVHYRLPDVSSQDLQQIAQMREQAQMNFNSEMTRFGLMQQNVILLAAMDMGFKSAEMAQMELATDGPGIYILRPKPEPAPMAVAEVPEEVPGCDAVKVG